MFEETMNPMSRNRVGLMLVGALAVGALAVVVVDEVLDDDEYASLSAAPVAAPLAPPSGADATVTAEEAAAIGAAATGGTAIDVWPGTEGGRSVFYVDVRTADGLAEVYVDAATGEVLRVEGAVSAPASAPAAATASTDAPASPPAASAAVTAEEAAAIGAAATGGTAIDVWPGTEGGRSVFYVDVRTADGLAEVYVDAATGEVLQIQPGD